MELPRIPLVKDSGFLLDVEEAPESSQSCKTGGSERALPGACGTGGC